MCKKVCKACGIEKALDDYGKSIENRDGKQGKCKQCVKNKIPIPQKVIKVRDGFKICTSCNKELSIENYVKDKYTPSGLAGNCKLCRKKDRENIKKAEKIIPLNKKCTRCELSKASSEFSKKSASYDGLNSFCKSCATIKYHKGLENKTYIEVDFKTCNKCKFKKSIESFHKNIASKDGHSNSCIECSLDYGKAYYQENRDSCIEYAKIRRENNPEESKNINSRSYYKNIEKRKKSSKIYRSNNKEYLKEVNKKWREDNKDYLKIKKKEYRQNNRHIDRAWLKKKKDEDPLFKLSLQIRVSFNNIFKKILDGKVTKNKTSLEILCCSFEEFFDHIESQFLSWMSFSNHGLCEEDLFDCSWHFDHIIPISYAKTEEEVYLLNHWSNFQPMCGKRNLSKNKSLYPCTNLELKITFWEDYWEYLE